MFSPDHNRPIYGSFLDTYFIYYAVFNGLLLVCNMLAWCKVPLADNADASVVFRTRAGVGRPKRYYWIIFGSTDYRMQNRVRAFSKDTKTGVQSKYQFGSKVPEDLVNRFFSTKNWCKSFFSIKKWRKGFLD